MRYSVGNPPTLVTSENPSDLKPILEKIMTEIAGIRTHLAGARKPFYTVAEIARLTGRTPYTVRRWISEKRIKADRVAGTGPKGRLLIASDQLDALIVAGQGAEIPASVLDGKE